MYLFVYDLMADTDLGADSKSLSWILKLAKLMHVKYFWYFETD